MIRREFMRRDNSAFSSSFSAFAKLRIVGAATAVIYFLMIWAADSMLGLNLLRLHTWLPEGIVRDFMPLHAIDAFSARNKMLFLNASGDSPYFGYKEDFRKAQMPLWKMARHFKVTVWILTAVLGFFLVLLYGRTSLSFLKNLFLCTRQLVMVVSLVGFFFKFQDAKKIALGS
jgi:hypothetical protein